MVPFMATRGEEAITVYDGMGATGPVRRFGIGTTRAIAGAAFCTLGGGGVKRVVVIGVFLVYLRNFLVSGT